MTTGSDDDDIGYGHPPKASQFQPGQSGNPKGRTKGIPNFKTDLLNELREEIQIRENGREMQISKQRAFIKSLVASAIKGDMRATNVLMSVCARSFDDDPQDDPSTAGDTEDADIVNAFAERHRARRNSPKKSKTTTTEGNELP